MSNPCKSLGMAPYNSMQFFEDLKYLSNHIDEVLEEECNSISDKFIKDLKELTVPYSQYLDKMDKTSGFKHFIHSTFGQARWTLISLSREMSWGTTYHYLDRDVDAFNHLLEVSDFKREVVGNLTKKMDYGMLMSWVIDVAHINITETRKEIYSCYKALCDNTAIPIERVPNMTSLGFVKYSRSLVNLLPDEEVIDEKLWAKRYDALQIIESHSRNDLKTTSRFDKARSYKEVILDTLKHVDEQINIDSKAQDPKSTQLEYYVSADLQTTLSKARSL